jgi:hypothetical protein
MIRLLVLPALLLLSGCADLEVVLPNPRVETPEVRGQQYKWKWGVSGGDNHAYEATDNAGERPPNMNVPTVRGYADVHPGAAFSLTNKWEIGGEINTLGKGLGLVTKLQLLGAGSSSAKKGNFPVALFARVGSASGSNSGDQSSTFGDGGYPWNGKVQAYYGQAGVSAGFRPGDHALLYGGLAYAKYTVDSEIKQDPNAPTDPVGGTYKASADGEGMAAAFGAMFSWPKVQFWVSGALTKVDYGKTDDMESVFLHTGVAFTPGGSSPEE